MKIQRAYTIHRPSPRDSGRQSVKIIKLYNSIFLISPPRYYAYLKHEEIFYTARFFYGVL
jgi:hypothetical protein